MKQQIWKMLTLILCFSFLLGTAAHAAEAETVTRGAFVQALYEAHQSRFQTDSENESAVDWAQAAGILRGFGDGQLRLGDAVSRGQAVVMLHRYAKMLVPVQAAPEDALENYGDAASVPAWCRNEVAWAVAGRLWFSGEERLEAAGPLTAEECDMLLKAFYQNGMPLETDWTDCNTCETANLTAEVSDSAVTVTLCNEGTDWLFYGADYGVYHKVNGSWYQLNADWAWIAMGYELEPGKTAAWEIYTVDGTLGQLPAGEYRVTKSFQHMDSAHEPVKGQEHCLLAVDFTIPE